MAGDWLQIAVGLDGDLIGDVAVRLSDDGRIAKIGYTIARAHQRGGSGSRPSEPSSPASSKPGSTGSRPRSMPATSPRPGCSNGSASVTRAPPSSAELANGEWCDVAYYAILRDEHEPRVNGSARPATPA